MTQVTLPYTLSDGQRSYAARLMENFEALADAINESLSTNETITSDQGAATVGAVDTNSDPTTVQALLDVLAAGIANRSTTAEMTAAIATATNDSIVGAVFDSINGNIVFTQKDGSTITVNIGSFASGVSAFNGRSGAVIPAAGDYTYSMVGAASITDPRLNDARTPVAHAASHATGGSDALSLAGIGAAPAVNRITTGNTFTLADNTEYVLSGESTITFSAPDGNFGCWGVITTPDSGVVSITLPAGATYMNDVPSFGNSETWEFSVWNNRWVWGKAE